jgi:hypothetical protein
VQPTPKKVSYCDLHLVLITTSFADQDAELEAWSKSFIAWFKTALSKKRSGNGESSASEGTSSCQSDDSDISADEGYPTANKKTE